MSHNPPPKDPTGHFKFAAYGLPVGIIIYALASLAESLFLVFISVVLIGASIIWAAIGLLRLMKVRRWLRRKGKLT